MYKSANKPDAVEQESIHVSAAKPAWDACTMQRHTAPCTASRPDLTRLLGQPHRRVAGQAAAALQHLALHMERQIVTQLSIQVCWPGVQTNRGTKACQTGLARCPQQAASQPALEPAYAGWQASSGDQWHRHKPGSAAT